MAYLLDLPTHRDYRGALTVVEKLLPFPIKRIYYIYEVPDSRLIRGGHSHRVTSQALICVHGSCHVDVREGSEMRTYKLSSPASCLVLNPEDWHTMGSFSQGSVLLVLASEFFDADDYIDEELAR